MVKQSSSKKKRTIGLPDKNIRTTSYDKMEIVVGRIILAVSYSIHSSNNAERNSTQNAKTGRLLFPKEYISIITSTVNNIILRIWAGSRIIVEVINIYETAIICRLVESN